MHTPYLTNNEDIEFLKLSSAKQLTVNSVKTKHIGELGSLPQFHVDLNLDKEYSIVL
jgi:hypothetical protein